MSPEQQRSIHASLDRHLDVARQIREGMTPAIIAVGDMLIDCLAAGGKLLICGNGGSAADAQHLAAELTGRFRHERRALPAIALTTDSSALTAIGNDFGFDRVFARQIEALARPGDICMAISTSGNSENVIAAVRAARNSGCRTIALSGRGGGSLASQTDLALIVPSDDTPVIQEMHIVIIHLLCDLVDRHFVDSR